MPGAFSAVDDVRSLDRAVELVRARNAGDDAYREASIRVFRDVDAACDDMAAAVALVDLVNALVRLSSVLALTNPHMPREDAIAIAYDALCRASIDHEPDDG